MGKGGGGISKGSLCQLLVQVVTCQVLEVGLLDVAVLGPDDLPTAVHTHGWLFSTKLKREGREGGKRGKGERKEKEGGKEGIEGERNGKWEGGRGGQREGEREVCT